MKDKVIFEEQDNWINFSYSENRILDSLAAIFHVQSPCTAVALYDSTLHISYNTHITKSDKITPALNSLLLKGLLDKDCNMLFSLHLLTNRDFSDFINLQKKHELNKESQIFLLNFINELSKIKNSLYEKIVKNTDDFSDCLEVIPLYFRIYDYYNPRSCDKWIVEKFLRPLQDVYKASYYLSDLPKIKQFNILDNKDGLHAECNVLNQLDFIKYVGISKLSCALCHKYLTDSNHEHRGTHGLFDEKWFDKMIKSFIKPLQQKVFSQFFIDTGKEMKSGDDISGHRKISIDFFEQEIPLPFGQMTLWDFKTQLGFIKKVKPIKIEQSNISCEEIITKSNVEIVNSNYTDPNVLKVIGGGGESWENSEDLHC